MNHNNSLIARDPFLVIDEKKPTALFLIKSVLIKAHMKKRLKKRFYIIEEKKQKEVINRLKKTLIDLVFIESSPFFKEALEILTWIKHSSEQKPTPVILIDPENGTLEKKASERGVVEFLYDPFDELECERKMESAFQKKELGNGAKKTAFFPSIKETNSPKSTVEMDVENSVTLLIQIQSFQFVQKEMKKKDEEVFAKNLIAEIQKISQENLIFMQKEKQKILITLPKGSYEKAANIAAHLVNYSMHPLVFSIIKKGKTPLQKERFQKILEKTLLEKTFEE